MLGNNLPPGCALGAHGEGREKNQDVVSGGQDRKAPSQSRNRRQSRLLPSVDKNAQEKNAGTCRQGGGKKKQHEKSQKKAAEKIENRVSYTNTHGWGRGVGKGLETRWHKLRDISFRISSRQIPAVGSLASILNRLNKRTPDDTKKKVRT